jgi:3-hydroxybutyrate dehydrogenase
LSLQNKTAILTGGTGGTGSTLARVLYDAGCNLVLTYTDEKNLDGIDKQLRNDTGRVLPVRADVSVEKEVGALFERAEEQFNGCDILLNSVGGYMDTKPFTELKLEEWERMMERNLTTCFLTCREALRRLRGKSYGRIINISAKPGLYPEAERGAYGVAKAGVAMLTRILGLEYRRTGVTINAIAPSIIRTPANESWGEEGDMKHWVTPEQIGDIVLFLCKDSSVSITGTVIEAYGGV